MIKTLFHGPAYYKALAARMVARFQPGYFEEENAFQVDITEGGDITLHAPSATLYVFNEEDCHQLAGFAEVVSCDYVEKIYRYKVTLKNFNLTQAAFVEPTPKQECKVTFRKGGDYVSKEGSREVYGSQLKRDNFTPSGLLVSRLDGSQVQYDYA